MNGRFFAATALVLATFFVAVTVCEDAMVDFDYAADELVQSWTFRPEIDDEVVLAKELAIGDSPLSSAKLNVYGATRQRCFTVRRGYTSGFMIEVTNGGYGFKLNRCRNSRTACYKRKVCRGSSCLQARPCFDRTGRRCLRAFACPDACTGNSFKFENSSVGVTVRAVNGAGFYLRKCPTSGCYTHVPCKASDAHTCLQYSHCTDYSGLNRCKVHAPCKPCVGHFKTIPALPGQYGVRFVSGANSNHAFYREFCPNGCFNVKIHDGSVDKKRETLERCQGTPGADDCVLIVSCGYVEPQPCRDPVRVERAATGYNLRPSNGYGVSFHKCPYNSGCYERRTCTSSTNNDEPCYSFARCVSRPGRRDCLVFPSCRDTTTTTTTTTPTTTTTTTTTTEPCNPTVQLERVVTGVRFVLTNGRGFTLKRCPKDTRDCYERRACDASSGVPDICTLPQVIGPCEARIPRYFYNATSQQCELFMYGGCGGNDNNFASWADCQSSCRSSISCLSTTDCDSQDASNPTCQRITSCKFGEPCKDAVRPIPTTTGFLRRYHSNGGIWLRPCPNKDDCFEKRRCAELPSYLSAQQHCFDYVDCSSSLARKCEILHKCDDDTTTTTTPTTTTTTTTTTTEPCDPSVRFNKVRIGFQLVATNDGSGAQVRRCPGFKNCYEVRDCPGIDPTNGVVPNCVRKIDCKTPDDANEPQCLETVPCDATTTTTRTPSTTTTTKTEPCDPQVRPIKVNVGFKRVYGVDGGMYLKPCPTTTHICYERKQCDADTPASKCFKYEDCKSDDQSCERLIDCFATTTTTRTPSTTTTTKTEPCDPKYQIIKAPEGFRRVPTNGDGYYLKRCPDASGKICYEKKECVAGTTPTSGCFKFENCKADTTDPNSFCEKLIPCDATTTTTRTPSTTTTTKTEPCDPQVRPIKVNVGFKRVYGVDGGMYLKPCPTTTHMCYERKQCDADTPSSECFKYEDCQSDNQSCERLIDCFATTSTTRTPSTTTKTEPCDPQVRISKGKIGHHRIYNGNGGVYLKPCPVTTSDGTTRECFERVQCDSSFPMFDQCFEIEYCESENGDCERFEPCLGDSSTTTTKPTLATQTQTIGTVGSSTTTKPTFATQTQTIGTVGTTTKPCEATYQVKKVDNGLRRVYDVTEANMDQAITLEPCPGDNSGCLQKLPCRSLNTRCFLFERCSSTDASCETLVDCNPSTTTKQTITHVTQKPTTTKANPV